jgi:hypothetical protein
MDTFVIRDTHKLIAKLGQRGFSAQQAEAEGHHRRFEGLYTTTLVTKADPKDALRDFEVHLYKFLAGVLIAQGFGTVALTVSLIELLK